MTEQRSEQPVAEWRVKKLEERVAELTFVVGCLRFELERELLLPTWLEKYKGKELGK